jgi:hypothetical protein
MTTKIHLDENGNKIVGKPFNPLPGKLDWFEVPPPPGKGTSGAIYVQLLPLSNAELQKRGAKLREQQRNARASQESQRQEANRALSEPAKPAAEPPCDPGAVGGKACVMEIVDRTMPTLKGIAGYEFGVSADIGPVAGAVLKENPFSRSFKKGGVNLGGRSIPIGGLSVTENGVIKGDLIPGPVDFEVGADGEKAVEGTSNVGVRHQVNRPSFQAPGEYSKPGGMTRGE